MDAQPYQKSVRRVFQQNLLLSRALENKILLNVSGAESVVLGRQIIVRQCDAVTGETVFTGEWSTIGGKITNTGLFTASALFKDQATEIAEFSRVRLIDITFL